MDLERVKQDLEARKRDLLDRHGRITRHTRHREAPLSQEDIRRVWEWVAKAPNWWMEIEPFEPDQIARLYGLARAARWEVFFLTKRPPSAGDSRSWAWRCPW